MDMDTVSVIIPSFNRFNYVLNTIKSIKEQSYKVHEIIVVNDCSTQQEYYNYDWESLGVIIVHLKKNSKKNVQVSVCRICKKSRNTYCTR